MLLEGGWRVLRRTIRHPRATGGCFSHGYIVEHTSGQQAYLKALDFSEAFASDDPARALQFATQLFNFERDLYQKCTTGRLSRIVTAIADGKCRTSQDDPATIVQYLIFELASYDVRTQLDLIDSLDVPWALRALHHIAAGLRQLHGIGIAHQDLKPSNVLVFAEESVRSAKVADLGRSVYRGSTGPYDHLHIPGDPAYAPPEFLYSAPPSGWNLRRLGYDAYLLGSMVVFFFARVNMNSLLKDQLHPDHHWENWGDTYDLVLPYLRDAFDRAILRFATTVPPILQDHISRTVRELCDPDPSIRAEFDLSLQQYLSRFDFLATRAELGLLEGVRPHGNR